MAFIKIHLLLGTSKVKVINPKLKRRRNFYPNITSKMIILQMLLQKVKRIIKINKRKK